MSLQHLCNSECSSFRSWTPNPPALPYIRQTQLLWTSWPHCLSPLPFYRTPVTLDPLGFAFLRIFALRCTVWNSVLREVTWLDLMALLSLLSASSLCSNVVSYVRPLLPISLNMLSLPMHFPFLTVFSPCYLSPSDKLYNSIPFSVSLLSAMNWKRAAIQQAKLVLPVESRLLLSLIDISYVLLDLY